MAFIAVFVIEVIFALDTGGFPSYRDESWNREREDKLYKLLLNKFLHWDPFGIQTILAVALNFLFHSCLTFCLDRSFVRNNSRSYKAEAKLWTNHEAEAKAEAWVFLKHKAEAKAAAQVFPSYNKHPFLKFLKFRQNKQANMIWKWKLFFKFWVKKIECNILDLWGYEAEVKAFAKSQSRSFCQVTKPKPKLWVFETTKLKPKLWPQMIRLREGEAEAASHPCLPHKHLFSCPGG